MTLPAAVKISYCFNLKFGIEDFTDPGLLKIRLTLTGLSWWFCLRNCFSYSHYFKQLDYVKKNHDLITSGMLCVEFPKV